jgi:hypothetical protein
VSILSDPSVMANAIREIRTREFLGVAWTMVETVAGARIRLLSAELSAAIGVTPD